MIINVSGPEKVELNGRTTNITPNTFEELVNTVNERVCGLYPVIDSKIINNFKTHESFKQIKNSYFRLFPEKESCVSLPDVIQYPIIHEPLGETVTEGITATFSMGVIPNYRLKIMKEANNFNLCLEYIPYMYRKLQKNS